MATLAEYRLALRAPVEWAAPTIADGAGPFTIGPLTEVIAQEHSWQELANVLAPGPAAGVIAHERVLRGEPVDAATVGRFPAIEMPYQLAAWEPAYLLATYRDDGVEAPAPPVPTTPGPARVAAAAHGRAAPRRRLRARRASAGGAVDRGVQRPGRGRQRGRIGRRRRERARVGSRRTGEISLTEALSWLAWAGASGGAHGRRRGAALGRFGALWTLAALLDLVDDWPLPLDELGDIAADLRWHWWDAGEPFTGWRLQLAVEDRVEGLAWAISARDDV